MKNFLCALLVILPLSACSSHDVIGMLSAKGPDVNERFESSRKLNESSPIPDVRVGTDEYFMYVVTDIHSRGECPNLVKFVSACLDGPDVEHVVLCLGDLVTGKESYNGVLRDIQPLYDAGWTLFSTPGNHDICFGLWQQYKEFWPRSTYQFRVVTKSAGTDLFIVLDSADGKLGVSQREWLEDVLLKADGESYRNIYVLTHTHFFRKDGSQETTGNYSLEETMDLVSLFSTHGVDCVLSGHDHYYEYTRFRNVDFYTLSALTEKIGRYYLAAFGEKLKLSEICVQ